MGKDTSKSFVNSKNPGLFNKLGFLFDVSHQHDDVGHQHDDVSHQHDDVSHQHDDIGHQCYGTYALKPQPQT